MSGLVVLSERVLREAKRTPDAIIPILLIPLFFLLVNVGQAADIFPEGTEWLAGQNYAAFQLPSTLILAASFGTAALFLVEEIENGYLDKLRATPVPRSSIVLGRLAAEFVKSVGMTVAIEMPKGSEMRTISTVIPTDFTNSAAKRPNTIDDRGTGVARNLSR